MAGNTMATIEPRLMHLLNVNDSRDNLPSIHSTLGAAPDSTEDAVPLLLPPLELNSPESSAGKQPQQSLQPPPIGSGHVAPMSSSLASSAGDDPSNTGAGSTSMWSSRPLRMLLTDTPTNGPEAFSLHGGLDDPSSASGPFAGKRPHILPHSDELIQLPQPLKKQKSTQQVGSLNQVFPPIINGLHEPPPNAAVFPPIAYEFDDDEALNRGPLTADYGSHAGGAGVGGGLGGGNGGHYLLDSILTGTGAQQASEMDRTGDVSLQLAAASRMAYEQSSLPALSPRHDKGYSAKMPMSSTRSTTEDIADAAESPEAPSSSTASSVKPKRRATKPRRRWTEVETNQLLIGVSRHGLGKWTAILEDPEFSFSNRTAGDLKDRFRTCCPDELRGNLAAGSPPESSTPPATIAGPSTATSSRLKTKTSLSLEDILIESDDRSEACGSQGNEAAGPSTSPDQPKMRKRRVHRRNMEDMIKLGIQGPFKKSHRRERRPFTEQDDKQILEGLQIYGPAWTKIHRHPSFNLASRQPTDLRDRVRNKYPDIYANIEKGALQPSSDVG